MTAERRELRCKSCGLVLGLTYHAGRLVTWCSEDCAKVTVFANEERDELVVAMFFLGATTPAIASYFDGGTSTTRMTYQNVQQILKKWHIPLNGHGGVLPATDKATRGKEETP